MTPEKKKKLLKLLTQLPNTYTIVAESMGSMSYHKIDGNELISLFIGPDEWETMQPIINRFVGSYTLKELSAMR